MYGNTRHSRTDMGPGHDDNHARGHTMKITVETTVAAPIEEV
jgi:hypothetical protein